MKKINKKRIILLIILICLLILQIKAFTDSQANKVLEITLSAKDSKSILEDSLVTLEAIDEGKSGYALILPEVVNEKRVSKYYITEKNIETDKEVDTTNVMNKSTEEAVSSKTEKKAGDKIYLTEEEIQNQRLEIDVEYDTITEGNTMLYYEEKETKLKDGKIIMLEGYVENGTKVKIESRPKEEITQIDTYLNEYTFYSAYNICLEKESTEKVITSGNITISVESEELGERNNKEYKILNILDNEKTENIEMTTKDTEKIETVKEIESVEISENKISFETEKLSTFVILEKEKKAEEVSDAENSGIIQDDSAYAVMNNDLLMEMNVNTGVDAWDGSISDSFSWGTGSEETPYLIADGADLAYLAVQVRNGNTYEGQYFQIANDIDLGGREWTPIGTNQNSFRGILDGAGHTIYNAQIIVASLPDKTYETYGIFASLGGENTRTIIRNLELSNINIDITASGDTGSVSSSIFGGGVNQDSEGLHIGTLVGAMYKNTSIENVIVNNSIIQDTGVMNIIDSPFQFSVGGVVGYVSNAYNNNNNPGNGSTYIIDNCYSETQISLDVTAAEGTAGSIFNRVEYNGHGQYHTGGIVGTVRGQAVWPTNTLYSGSIKANGLIGPIFGALINNSGYDDYNTYPTIWNGNNAGNVDINNMYFTNYTANGTTFTTSVQSGNSNQRISNSSTNIGYVQGVNKGIYTNDMNTILTVFNNRANNNEKYIVWNYQDGEFSFKERLTTKEVENPKNTFHIEITDPYEIGEYILRWYKNGTEDTSIQGISYTVPAMREEDENILVLTYDGEYYAVTKFLIPKTGVYINFHIDENNNSVTSSLDIVGLEDVYESDYEYQWYICDISGSEEELIKDATSLTLNNLEKGIEYKLVATNTRLPEWTVENSFIYGNRTVIYVSYDNGNDRNNGFTPETPVRNISTAYGKLDRNGNRNTNIIVLMDMYESNNTFDSESSNTYNKPATITGKYQENDYQSNGSGLYLHSGDGSWWGSQTVYKYLCADTTFQYVDWYGDGEELYLLAQGYSVTIGEGVTMVNYASANRNQGLLGGNAPAVHLFAGWLQYNETQLPRNNSKIIIKSGTFGRLVGGGTPGTSAGQGQSISHDFMGSSKEDSFNLEITVDIENSTKGSYDYDINLLTGGSAAGNNYSNVIQNIKNGSVGRLIGGSIGDSATRPRNWNYPENTFLGTATVNMTGGSIEELYGGCLGRNMNVVNNDGSVSSGATGNTCDSYFYGTVTIHISGGEITGNIYGAGAGGVTGYSQNSSDPYKSYGQEFDTSVNINIEGGNIKGNIYGGGYGYTEYLNANVTADDGGSLYGDSHISISGSPVIEGDIYAAGCGYNYSSRQNLAQMEGTSNIEITGTPTIQGNIFGGGAGVSGYEEMAKLIGDVNINIKANLSTEVYGGGNIAKTEGNTNMNIDSGNHTSSMYGGGNVGEIQGNTVVNINGGTQETVYGGGNQAKVTNATVNIIGGTSNIVYAGGNSADVENTKIMVTGGNTTTIYGGSNQTGTVNKSNIETTNGTMGTIYGGNNIGGTTLDAIVTINGGSITEAIYGGGNQVDTNKTTLHLQSAQNPIPNIFGGGNQAGVPETYIYGEGIQAKNVFGGSNTNGIVQTSNVEINAGTYENVYGGNNQGGETTTSNVTINDGTIQNVYGGNNLGGICETTNVTVNDGTITDVYGGGNQAVTNVTNIQINGPVARYVYGGGNQAGVNTSTNVNLLNATVGDNVYGGGNEGTVTENTNVHVKDSILQNSLYAGGNGSSAIVYGSTNLLMEGTKNNVIKNVFGGGNKAPTGTNEKHTSSTVNIVGGTIGGNVYGGANTSVVYGTTSTKIGYDAVGDNSLEMGDVNIVGTIFGGGEANEAGDENYDFSFISVTDGTDILIDGNQHENFAITGSIFGSGNASSTSGQSYITIKNYGTVDSPQYNISLQRANLATIINSAISLSGATDRTNEYSTTFFAISRVDEVKLKNNSTLYLQNGANLLKKLDSVVDDESGNEVKGTVTINPDTGDTVKNVDNRIYMLEGKNLNIATNEQVTTYGEVYGMFFFGLFSSRNNPSTSTGLYNHEYDNGETITNEGTFISNSYAMGQHMANHDITVDGFYTNYNEEGKIKVNYITPTPDADVYYIWTVGEQMNVKVFNVELTASKYITLGTYELLLQGFSTPNVKYVVTGFSPGLANGVTLVDPSEINSIEQDEEKANNVLGLTMETGNSGWETNGSTTFLTEGGGSYTGTTNYNKDNSSYTPTLNLCLYHSQNITEKRALGDVRIRIQVLTPIDDLNYEISWIDIVVTISSNLFQDDFYEGAITPGQKFGLFTSTDTTITSRSDFSVYFSHTLENFDQCEYYNSYLTDERVLVSTDANGNPYSFPENTKLTMLDMVTNTYYYYVVTNEDVAQNKYVYKLADFIAMGSQNKKYDEQTESQKYYLQDQNLLYENFIFHVSFADTNMTENIQNNSLLMELRDDGNQTLVGVLGIQRDVIRYSVYCNQDATIELDGNLSPTTVYLGEQIDLNVETTFTQTVVDSKRVYDTQYFDKKLGIKITIYDMNGNKLNVDSLLGVNFELDGQKYYPRVDGTTRINIADKVTDVLARIKINTEDNTTWATGDYKIVIESFGSSDGIYYGLTASDSIELNVTIINSSYGLKVVTNDSAKIVDKETGNTVDGINSLVSTVEYSSALDDPNITVSLYRRTYNDVYSREYEQVDLQDYVLNTLMTTNKEKEYMAFNHPNNSQNYFLNLKSELMTGTYRLVYTLYDGEIYVGEAYEYIVIK